MVPVGAVDEHVERLARLFREHPAWVRAGRRLVEGASSQVSFSHRPGESWYLLRRGGRSLLLPGLAPDPDFAFRFTPAAIERLAAVQGGFGDVAVELFSLIASEDAALRVGFRVVAPFARLLRRGYVGLLLAGGPRFLAFGAAHGVRTLRDVRRLVRRARASRPER